ncbi:type II toxin-antitoxin system HicB family antitoxin [Lactiplantibacillus pentosus]|uniref:type II toxin-antitoxin system HicB family antitoxin n=1 Tax=Lactiplantibacillus pentosus TaxID=1589 RepID=UPI003D7BA2FB
MTKGNHIAVYPAVFTEQDGKFLVAFPDIPAINTIGDTEEEAVLRAKEALELSLYLEKWPTPTKISDVVLGSEDHIVMICADVRNAVGRSPKVRKQVTISEVYLQKMQDRGLGLSETINSALKEKLDEN